MNRVFVSVGLMPAQNSVLPWELSTITDVEKGGTSSISVNESSSSLDYNYVLTKDVQYPHVTAVVAFDKLQNAEKFVDFSQYSTLVLEAKCAPHNVLSFHLHSFDPQVTERENFSSYRIAEKLFSCNDKGSKIEIDLQHLSVATWWLESFGVDIAEKNYWLDKVIAFSFGASPHGPTNQLAHVNIKNIALHGVEWRYVWFLAITLILIWPAYVYWLFRYYTQSLIVDLKAKMQQDRPLIAYQQLSIEPHRDKEKSQILRFMATEYANPELSLEMAISTLGLNRTKINEILKEELGFTFNAYMNKLRLAEAARLLSETEEVNVSEIAYSVGYNNVTYFNKLFRNEYGCTPKVFKSFYQ